MACSTNWSGRSHIVGQCGNGFGVGIGFAERDERTLVKLSSTLRECELSPTGGTMTRVDGAAGKVYLCERMIRSSPTTAIPAP
jgi:hypothetical protein